MQAGDTRIAAGDRVLIQPRRRATPWICSWPARVARVEAVHRDVDGMPFVAVALDDEAQDLNSSYKRFFYFDPDELRPISEKES